MRNTQKVHCFVILLARVINFSVACVNLSKQPTTLMGGVQLLFESVFVTRQNQIREGLKVIEKDSEFTKCWAGQGRGIFQFGIPCKQRSGRTQTEGVMPCIIKPRCPLILEVHLQPLKQQRWGLDSCWGFAGYQEGTSFFSFFIIPTCLTKFDKQKP